MEAPWLRMPRIVLDSSLKLGDCPPGRLVSPPGGLCQKSGERVNMAQKVTRDQFNVFAQRIKSEALAMVDSAKKGAQRLKEEAKKNEAVTITAVGVPVGMGLGTFASGRFLGPDRKGVSAAIGLAVSAGGCVGAIMDPKRAPYFIGLAAIGSGMTSPAIYQFAIDQRAKAQAASDNPPDKK